MGIGNNWTRGSRAAPIAAVPERDPEDHDADVMREPWKNAGLVRALFDRAQQEMADLEVLRRQAMLKRGRISGEWIRRYGRKRPEDKG